VSDPLIHKRTKRLPKPANDNAPRTGALRSEVLIPADLPITQAEIEVFAALMDDLAALAANDNEEVPE
jgi:hypothetical protein